VTEDGKIAVECEGDKSDCSFTAQAQRMSVEQGKCKLVLEGSVSLRYRWKDGKTGGLVEAERICFDVNTGALQIETCCKQQKKTVNCHVERAKYAAPER